MIHEHPLHDPEYRGVDAHIEYHDDRLPPPPPQATIEDLLDDAIALVAEARAMPMSTTVKVNRDELLDLLEGAREALPAEVRAARNLLRDRDDFLANARAEREQIIEQGRSHVSHMIERQEIVKAAELRARQIVEEARSDAKKMQLQVEDYCDQKLASFENVLDKTARTIRHGRERLAGRLEPTDLGPADFDEHGR